MMKSKRRVSYLQEAPGLDISSLIDVCFLLLIYFIVSTSIKASEQDVSLRLPDGLSKTASEIEPYLVKIDERGALYRVSGVADEALDLDVNDRDTPLLNQSLGMYKQGCDLTGNRPVVQVQVHGEATQQRVLDVLNAFQKHDIKAVTFTDLID